MSAEEIVAAARACLGTPFRHQGRRAGQGLDCAGLAIHVARTLGYPVGDVSGYGRDPAPGQLRAALQKQPALIEIPRGQEAAGDLVLMRWADHPQHLGVCAGETLIHAHQPSGKVVEQLLAPWSRLIVAVYRFREDAA